MVAAATENHESLLGLVRVLSKGPAPWPKVERIVRMCPRLPDELSTSNGRPPTTFQLSAAGQDAVLAVARFVVLSGGQFAAQLVPVVLKYLHALPYMSCISRARRSRYATKRFGRLLISYCIRIANRTPEMAQLLVEEVLYSLEQSLSLVWSNKDAPESYSDIPGGAQALQAASQWDLSYNAIATLAGFLKALGDGRFENITEQQIGQLTALVTVMISDEKLRTLLSDFERRELEEEGTEGVSEDLVNELAHLDAHRDDLVPVYPQVPTGELPPLPIETSRAIVYGGTTADANGAGASNGGYQVVAGGPRAGPSSVPGARRRTTLAQVVEAEFPPLPQPALLDGGYVLRPLLLRTMAQITQSLELAGAAVEHGEQFTLAFFDAAIKALADLGLAVDEESRRRGHLSPGSPALATIAPAGPGEGPHPAVVLLTAASRLAVRCAVLVPALKGRVVAFTTELLKDMAGASQLDFARILEHASSAEIAEFYSRSLRGAAELAARYPDIALALADTLRSVLTAPILNDPRAVGLLLREEPALRDEIIRTVCVILKTCAREARRTGGPRAAEQLSGAVSSLIYSVFNQMGSEGGPSERLQLNHSTENFILLVGRIATATSDPKIVESLVPYLLECFYRPGAQQLHGAVLDQLTGIALLGHEGPYREAVDLMEKLYRSPFDEKHKGAVAKIPQCLQTLAAGLKPEKLRADLRRRMLLLFNTIGADISARSAQSGFGAQANSMAGALGALLPALADSLGEADERVILEAEAGDVKAFRSVWFYSVLYGFVNEGQWLPEWHQALKRVADRSPVLVTRKSHNYLETEISIQNMLTKSPATEKTLADMLKMISHLSPNVNSSFFSSARISFAQATYVLSVFHLERMRVLHGGRRLYCIFAYLEDAGIELLAGTGVNAGDTAKLLMDCIVGLADQVIVTFMAAMEVMGPTAERQAILEQQMVTLLTNLCSRVPRARTAAERFTHWVIQKFPQVLFVGRTWRTLLSLLEVVGNSCERSAGSVATYLLPWSEGELNLPEELHDRAAMLQNLSRLCSQWLTFAFTVAPAETQTLLQEYLQSFRSLSLSLLGHFGSSVVVEVGAQRNAKGGGGPAPAPSGGPAAQAPAMQPGGAAGQFVASLELKAYNAGEISGMRHIFADLARNLGSLRSERALGAPRLPFGPTVGRHLVAAFMEMLERHQDGDVVDFAEFDSLMYRSAAFLIADQEERDAAAADAAADPDERPAPGPGPDGFSLDPPAPKEAGYREQLLHLICWAPVYLFSPQTLQTGVFAWGWIAASLPESDTRLLSEICGAWGWSVEQRLGLFSHYSPPVDYSLPPDQQLGGEQGGEEDVDEDEVHLELPSLGRRFYRTNTTQRKRRPGKPAADGPQNLFDPSAHHVPYPRAHDIRPHRAWVDFLMERFEVVRYRSPQQIKIMAAMIHKALANPAALSLAPQAVGPRFKLLLLALRVANYSNAADQAGLALLRHRIYNATLSWFLCTPSYYDPGNNRELEADERTLIDFCKYIRAESQNNAGAVAPQPTPSGLGSADSIPETGLRLQRIESALNFTSLLAAPGAAPGDPSKPGTPARSAAASAHGRGAAAQAAHAAASNALPHGDFHNMRRVSTTPVVGPGSPTGAAAKRASGFSDAGAVSLRENLPESRALLVEMAGSFERRRQLVLLLVGHEVDRISAWRNPQNKPGMQLKDERSFTADRAIAPQQWSEMLRTAWQASPRLAVHLALRFPSAPLRPELEGLIKARPDLVTSVPEAIPFLVTEANVAANIPQLRQLVYWTRCPLTTALAFLGKTFQGNALVLNYALNTMRSFPPEAVVFYLPQICQSIRHDATGMVRAWLLEMCQRSDKFAHQLIWALRTESEVDEAKKAKGVPDRLPELVRELDQRIVAEFTDNARRVYREEFDFFNGINAISGILKPLEEGARKPKIIEELKKFSVSGGLYLPTNPDSRVVGIIYDSASPMQSAAKVPILVAFQIRDESPAALAAAAAAGRETPRARTTPDPRGEGAPGALATSASFSVARKSVSTDEAVGASPQKHPLDSRPGFGGRKRHGPLQRTLSTAEAAGEVRVQACIFKVGDDCRQDCLALQFIRLFKNIFQTVGLNLYLYPYRVVTTSPGCGIIECVPKAKSRDMVGKMSEGSLYEYFLLKYGHKDSLAFQKARRNFILSMAGYSVVSFILQIKDRHNGNILVDEDGHVIHIDFGFIFDISPGGDLKFERAPFKLSTEMIQIMGGGPQAEPFNFFVDMCCKAFLACRQHMESFLTLAELMKESGLPAYRPMTMQNLRNRFVPEKSERQAAAFMVDKITESYDKFSTMVYDEFQAWANGIER
eukprot:tig00021127_g18729.t1